MSASAAEGVPVTKGDLDGLMIWGRPLKPVALGTSILMATLVVYNTLDFGVFGALWLGDVVAVFAAASFICMVGGWVGRRQRMAESGLLAAFAAYVLRASFLAFTQGLRVEGLWLSLGAAVITGGAFLLEVWDRRRRIGL